MISTEQMATLSYVQGVQSALQRAGDIEMAKRVQDLSARLESSSHEVIVAFCGLFSAGKSSLLNALLNDGALKTGAVPTTSEVAEVVLPKSDGRVRLFDTPGIDSTDEAHQNATEAVLHRADVVVIVADYQHVEAESNLELAHALTSERKRVWFVVNQVDKHLDFELPFEEFQSSVTRALQTWEIDAEQVFYTSTRSSTHNQLDALAAALLNLGAHSDAWIREQVLASLHDVVEQHVNRVFAQQQEDVQTRVRQLFGVLPYEVAEAQKWLTDLSHQIQDLEASLYTEQQSLKVHQEEQRDNLMRGVDLAQIAPYGTTELGRAYIESLRSDFRIGWLSSQQKIEKERSRRLAEFVDDLALRTRTFLVWPLQGQLRAMVHAADWADEQWLGSVDRVEVAVTVSECQSQLKTGALVSSEYPYQYVKDVVTALKSHFGARLAEWLDDWFAAQRQHLDKQLAAQVAEQSELTQKHDALALWLQFQAERERQIASLLSAGETQGTGAAEGAADE